MESEVIEVSKEKKNQDDTLKKDFSHCSVRNLTDTNK